MSLLNGSEEATLSSKLYCFWTSLTVPYRSMYVSVTYNLQSLQDFTAVLTYILHSCVITPCFDDGTRWTNMTQRTSQDRRHERYLLIVVFLLLILLLICLLLHKAAFFSTRPHSSPPYSQKCDRSFARPLYLHRTTQRQTRRQICKLPVGFEPTISTTKRSKTGHLRPRCHCDWNVFHYLLPYFFKGFTFHLEP